MRRKWQNYAFFHSDDYIPHDWFDVKVGDEMFPVVEGSALSDASTLTTRERQASSQAWALAKASTIVPAVGSGRGQALTTRAKSRAIPKTKGLSTIPKTPPAKPKGPTVMPRGSLAKAAKEAQDPLDLFDDLLPAPVKDQCGLI